MAGAYVARQGRATIVEDASADRLQSRSAADSGHERHGRPQEVPTQAPTVAQQRAGSMPLTTPRPQSLEHATPGSMTPCVTAVASRTPSKAGRTSSPASAGPALRERAAETLLLGLVLSTASGMAQKCGSRSGRAQVPPRRALPQSWAPPPGHRCLQGRLQETPTQGHTPRHSALRPTPLDLLRPAASPVDHSQMRAWQPEARPNIARCAAHRHGPAPRSPTSPVKRYGLPPRSSTRWPETARYPVVVDRANWEQSYRAMISYQATAALR
jgi:hypothetical protein